MRIRFTWTDILVGLVWLFPLAYLAYIYPSLPDKVPLHFNAQGQADGWGTRHKLEIVVWVLSAISLGTFLLIRFLPLIDPKRNVQSSASILGKISYALVFFLSGLIILTTQASVKGHLALNGRLLYTIFALFMAFLGNQMNSLKPNYFVGVRTPWTLENETVWKKTHQMAGRLWLIGGILIALLCLLLPDGAAFWAFISGLLVLGLIPVVYSYLLYRQIQKPS